MFRISDYVLYPYIVSAFFFVYTPTYITIMGNQCYRSTSVYTYRSFYTRCQFPVSVL